MSGTVPAPAPGRLFILGMGPGDPELVTVRAARILGRVPAIAYFAKAGAEGHARRIAAGYLGGRLASTVTFVRDGAALIIINPGLVADVE